MDHLIAWCGFLGAWLLVAGPLHQATRELEEEEIERDDLARIAIKETWELRESYGWAAVGSAVPFTRIGRIRNSGRSEGAVRHSCRHFPDVRRVA